MSFLRVAGVTKINERGTVLPGLSFTQNRFQKIAVAGETGSGKSTLLKIIAGLVQGSGGEVLFENVRVKGPEDQLLPGHKGIAYLSQQYELRNHYRVEELLDMANIMTDDEAATIYEVCRIGHLVKRRTDQLSGGEKQRIALARLLVTAPRLLILDEPFSNLDLIHKSILKEVIHDIGERLQITSLLASHDPLDVLSWADEIMVLKDGEIAQQGSPEELYRQPVNEYIAGLFGKYNLLPPSTAKALFPAIIIPDAPGKSMLVRPEQLQITEGAHAINAIIKEVKFMGAYYEVLVKASAQELILTTVQKRLAEGDSMKISLVDQEVWFI